MTTENAIGARGKRMKIQILLRVGAMAGVSISPHWRSSEELLEASSGNGSDDGA